MLMVQRREDCRCGICHASQFPSGDGSGAVVWSTPNSRDLTLRGGAAYELSPIQSPDERIAQLLDANRIWLGIGGSYGLN